MHVGDAPVGALHTVAQAPQLDVSELVSTQEPLQSTVGGEQLLAQLPPAQTWVGSHAAPQAPQFALSLARSTHAPLQ